MARSRLCSIPDCGKKHLARGLCGAHYQRWRTHGAPLGGRPTMNGDPMRYFHNTVIGYEGDECLPWPYAKNSHGYGHVCVDGRWLRVSRMVCEMFNGPPPSPLHDAAHSCGNGHMACVTKGHLSWKTRAGNAADRTTHGTEVRGVDTPSAKLTEDDVRRIRALRGKMFQRDIAKLFGVTQGNVGYIQRRATWAWLD